MPSKFEFNKGKMVPYPSGAIVPDRDLGERPALECIHLGIEFGGLKAVDDFSLTIGKTEIAGYCPYLPEHSPVQHHDGGGQR